MNYDLNTELFPDLKKDAKKTKPFKNKSQKNIKTNTNEEKKEFKDEGVKQEKIKVNLKLKLPKKRKNKLGEMKNNNIKS